MGDIVEFSADGSESSGYYAPAGGTASGAVVLIQEYWGLVPQIRGVADRLAAEGFATLVPDLYRGITTDERETASDLMNHLDLDRAVADLRGAVTKLSEVAGHAPPQVGCIGFCMGGGLAIYLATRDDRIAATTIFYGAIPWPGVELDFSAVAGPVLLHYATNDDFASPSLGRHYCRQLLDAGKPADLHLYEGTQHAFFDETRPDSHHADASRLAWSRTIDFLRRNLTRHLGNQGKAD